MIGRGDFRSLEAKCNLLRGRIVRFKTEAYTDFTVDDLQHLDIARAQLELIGEVAGDNRMSDARKTTRVQVGYGKANESLNCIMAIQRMHAEGNEHGDRS